MATKLFVGSLSYNTTDAGLEEFFAQAGTVVSAKVIFDRDTNRSKGFGFVEMSSDDEAKAAVEKLNGQDLDGRRLIVNEARPQENRERRSFGGGNGGGDWNRR
jgi:RNA recognition motif-containing protein